MSYENLAPVFLWMRKYHLLMIHDYEITHHGNPVVG